MFAKLVSSLIVVGLMHYTMGCTVQRTIKPSEKGFDAKQKILFVILNSGERITFDDFGATYNAGTQTVDGMQEKCDGIPNRKIVSIKTQNIKFIRISQVSGKSNIHHWFITVSSISSSNGPAPDIENAMIASGFNASSPSFFGAPIAHPNSIAGDGIPWMVALHKTMSPNFLAGVIMSGIPLGTTAGFHDPYLGLTTQYSAFTIAPVLSFHGGDVFHAGIGPALHFTRISRDDYGSTADKRSITKIGYLAHVGISLPSKTRFFLDLDFQYRYVGRIKIGPYNVTSSNNTAVFPRTSVSFNHTVIAFGVGIRL